MVRLVNFKLDRKLSPEVQNNLLTKFIDEFYKNKIFQNLINDLSNIFNIPQEKFDQDIKLYLITNFQNSKGKFFPKFSTFNSIFSFFKYTFLYLWILFYQSKKNTNKSYFELIIDDISHKDEAFRFKNFIKYFKSSIFISRVSLQKDFNYYLFNRYKNLNLESSINNKKLKVFFYYFKVLFFSLKNRTNYCEMIFKMINLIIKYESIFYSLKSRYLIQERHFTSSKLKNFIFKKNGGKKTLLFQRNIAQLNGPGMYTYSDIFFSLGNKTHLQYIKCKSHFKKIYPVGSFFMQAVKFEKKKQSSIPYFDLIHIASNMNYFQDTHYKFLDDWIEQFNWLKKLNYKFPKLKICIKGRKYDGMRKNKIFSNFLKNSSITFIDEHYEDKDSNKFNHDSSHSYDYALNSKVVCTWQSTMGFELLSLNKFCMFLDPGGRNSAHLPNDNFHNKVKVTSYENFEKLFFEIYESRFDFKTINTDDYCLNSDNTHEKIFKILNNAKN